MTESEAQQLIQWHKTNCLFELYTGEEKIGVLVRLEDEGDYYILPEKDLKIFEESPTVVKTNGQKVTLEAIERFEQYQKPSVYHTGVPFFEQHSTFNKKAKKPLGARKMIILGAGASFDYTSDFDIPATKRPPLTNNLFDDRFDEVLDKYPGAKLLAGSSLMLNNNLESFFQDKWDLVRTHYDPAVMSQLINTQFYLHEIFKNISNALSGIKRSNHTILSNLISDFTVQKKQPVIVVSFNYDTMLEKAISNYFQYPYFSMADYIAPERKLFLFKPHGSWNWIRESRLGGMSSVLRKGPSYSDSLYNQRRTYSQIFKELSDEIQVFDQLPSSSQAADNKSYLPQLLIPYTDKDDFVMPTDHLNLLEESLSEIDEIVIIGWKGTEKKFQSLLANQIGDRPIKITVASNKDETTQQALSPILTKANWNIQSTFTELMRQSLLDKKLFLV